jgi:hypothetical protein
MQGVVFRRPNKSQGEKDFVASAHSYTGVGRTKRKAQQALRKVMEQFNPELVSQTQWVREDSSFLTGRAR